MIVGRLSVATALVLGTISLGAQTPRPFPQPGPPQPQRPAPATNEPSGPVPTEATLGVAIYPNAQFITSYDAGRGQRFYLFGAATPFAEVVTFYRTALKQKGEVLFESPPTHQFETGRFREETMAFPPSVTIKDYTWGGSPGYPNPKKGPGPERFPTIIQIVPAAPGTPPGI